MDNVGMHASYNPTRVSYRAPLTWVVSDPPFFKALSLLCLPPFLSLSGLNALTFDPSSNNEPLQFGGAGAPLVTDCVPPLENGAENSKKRKRVSLPQGTDRHPHASGLHRNRCPIRNSAKA